jgi:hypothetical protein
MSIVMPRSVAIGCGKTDNKLNREVFVKMSTFKLWRPIAVTAVMLLAVGANAFAQLQTGNLYGTVKDQQSAALPGVTVTLDTGAAQEVQVTNARGEFRFLSLPPSVMKLKAELQGFSTVEYPNVSIAVGHNTSVEVTMNSAVEDVITVTAESPLLDERKISTGATLNQTELQKIPTSRDPWSILSSTPGVQVDRVNVGGNESSQQSVYVGAGSMNGNNIWAVDGVVITDMAATGSSPSYYDFDAFQEMQITTGGTDSTIATGGVVLNMVTKRGTNEWRGGARYLNTPAAAQSNTSFNNNQLAPTETSRPNSFNAIRGIDDFGGDIGGPIVRDHLWIWGSYGDQKISTLTTGGVPYNAQLPTYNGKINAQLTSSNSLTLFALENNKTVIGRDASPQRPIETTWNQGRSGNSPTAGKIEDTQIFGPAFYLTALASTVNGGFKLTPAGGLDATTYLDGNQVWHNSFEAANNLRPQQQGKLDASTFFNTGSLSNEVKFGASYRHVVTDSLSEWGGTGYILDGSLFAGDFPAGDNLLVASRASVKRVQNNYASAYLQDTVTSGNLTVNAGLRYDRQTSGTYATFTPANNVLPDLLPAFTAPGVAAPFSWNNVVPRIGATYALGKDRATLLRASYSRYADQLAAGVANFTEPTGYQSYFYFLTTSTGPGNPTPIPGTAMGYSGNVNPATGGPFINNAIASNLSAPTTDEGLVSIEHAFMPELVGNVNLTYRRNTNFIDTDLLVFDCSGTGAGCAGDLSNVGRQAQQADYTPVTTSVNLPNGSTRNVTYYILKPSVFTRGGNIEVNGSRDQTYEGASFGLTKRLSNRWMLRGNFTMSNWKWEGTQNLPDQTEGPGGGSRNGDVVLTASAGSGPKQYVYIGAKWTGSVNGLYQVVPDKAWGFNLAGNFTARQGYALPFFVQQPTNVAGNYPGNPRDSILVNSSPDSQRLPSVYDFDARIEKEFSFQDWGLTLGVDCFNVFNSSTVLQRVANLGNAASSPNTGDYVYEILSPRIFRFGARINFR